MLKAIDLRNTCVGWDGNTTPCGSQLFLFSAIVTYGCDRQ